MYKTKIPWAVIYLCHNLGFFMLYLNNIRIVLNNDKIVTSLHILFQIKLVAVCNYRLYLVVMFAFSCYLYLSLSLSKVETTKTYSLNIPLCSLSHLKTGSYSLARFPALKNPTTCAFKLLQLTVPSRRISMNLGN